MRLGSVKVSLIEASGIYAVIGILIPGSPLLDIADSGLNLAQHFELSYWYGIAAVALAHAAVLAVVSYRKRQKLK